MDRAVTLNLGVLPEIYDTRIWECGESPLWHPTRKQLYWVDVTTQKIITRKNGRKEHIQFDEFVTALAWVDHNHILAATETALIKINLDHHKKTLICALEAENSSTRSNDGRADPWGGFWISTMGKSVEENAGKIYRYYKGKLSVVIDAITIPNSICFNRSLSVAYFSDTATQKLYSIALDRDTGAPQSAPALLKDFSKLGHAIDGAIVDSEGAIWLGVWDGFQILKVSPEGKIVDTFATGAARPTCPAFGGPSFKDIYVTTAAIGLHETLSASPQQGKTLVFKGIASGQAEPQIILDSLNR